MFQYFSKDMKAGNLVPKIVCLPEKVYDALHFIFLHILGTKAEILPNNQFIGTATAKISIAWSSLAFWLFLYVTRILLLLIQDWDSLFRHKMKISKGNTFYCAYWSAWNYFYHCSQMKTLKFCFYTLVSKYSAWLLSQNLQLQTRECIDGVVSAVAISVILNKKISKIGRMVRQ